MKWTEEIQPNNEVGYNHVMCDTPLGRLIISWKGWKERPKYGFSSDINNFYEELAEECNTLDEAKQRAKEYIIAKYNDIKTFVENIQ
jgi:glutaredoxin-related protein